MVLVEEQESRTSLRQRHHALPDLAGSRRAWLTPRAKSATFQSQSRAGTTAEITLTRSCGMDERDGDYFELLREALDPANSPAPAPVWPLDREIVLDFHQNSIAKEADLDRRGEVRTRKLVVGPGKHFASGTGLDRLQKVTLAPASGLRVDEPARGELLHTIPLPSTFSDALPLLCSGKLLVCRIITKCVRLAAVEFIVEDKMGLVVPVHLYHIPARFSAADLNARYPVGAIYGTFQIYKRKRTS